MMSNITARAPLKNKRRFPRLVKKTSVLLFLCGLTIGDLHAQLLCQTDDTRWEYDGKTKKITEIEFEPLTKTQFSVEIIHDEVPEGEANTIDPIGRAIQDLEKEPATRRLANMLRETRSFTSYLYHKEGSGSTSIIVARDDSGNTLGRFVWYWYMGLSVFEVCK
jgi:hypothetical protein